MMAPRQTLVGLAIIGAIFVLDQLTKAWVLGLLEANNYRSIEITPFFNLVLVINRGVSFGMFNSGGNESHWLLILLPGLVVVWLLVWMLRSKELLASLGLAFVIGGAIGNITDRIFRPGVIDFFDFHAAGWHFWAFNIADSAISIGVVLLVYDAIFSDEKNKA